MRRFLLFLLGTSLCFGYSEAQNLVQNGGFETISNCPSIVTQLPFATPWQHPTSHTGSADLFNVCGTSPQVQVPSNGFGYQPAHSGNSYTGFAAFSDGATFREYLTAPLSNTLTAGAAYEVKLWVSLADQMLYATENIQVLLSTGAISGAGNNGALTSYAPQVSNQTGMLIDTTNWVLISGIYTAVGGESHITIGNFLDNSTTTSTTTGFGSYSFAYYYVDDVSVELAGLYITGDSTICQGDSAFLTAHAGTGYWWSLLTNPGVAIDNDSLLAVAPSVSTTYLCNTPTTIDTVTIHVFPTPVVNLGPDTTVCGDSLQMFVASGQGTILWSDSTSSTNFTTDTSGIFWVEVENSGCIVRDSINVTVQDPPVVSLGNDTGLCATSFSLDAGNTGMTYLWSTAEQTQTITVGLSGTYWVTVTDGACSTTDSIDVTLFPIPQVNLGNDTSFCQGTITLNAGNAGSTFLWSTGSTGQTQVVGQSDTVWVDVNNGTCVGRDSIIITIGPYPNVNLGGDTSVCGYLHTLDAGNSTASFSWNTGATTQQITVAASGIYHVQVTMGTCIEYDTIQVTLDFPTTPVNIGNDTAYCGAPVALFAGTNGDLLWSTGETDSVIQVSQTGIYWVEIRNGVCLDQDTIYLHITHMPDNDLPGDTLLCPGETLFLELDTQAVYLWSDELITPYRKLKAGNYWLRTTVGNCTVTDSMVIRKAAAPLLPELVSLCTEGLVTLDPGDIRGLHKWSDGYPEIRRVIEEGGVYELTVEEEHCIMKASSKITGSSRDAVYLPNAFWPDNNGVNDFFPGTIPLAQSYQLTVYDRWGEQLFLTTDPGLWWDGTFQGRECVPGVYIYQLSYFSECLGEPVTKTGHLTLVR